MTLRPIIDQQCYNEGESTISSICLFNVIIQKCSGFHLRKTFHKSLSLLARDGSFSN